MTFRVGLLFHFTPKQPYAVDTIVALLQKIDVKSTAVRNSRPLTLMPFVRTMDMVLFSQTVAGSGYAVEAAAFDEAGVTFGSLDAFANLPHPAYNDSLDFDLGMRVLLSCCDVIVIVCQDKVTAENIRPQLKTIYNNTSVLLALVSLQDGHTRFVEVDPLPAADKEVTDWLHAVTERWKARQAIPHLRPASKWIILGRLFPWLNSVLIGQWFETVKKKPSTEAERCRSGIGLSATVDKKLVAADRNSLDAVLRVICPYFDRHDGLGRHYSNVFRTTCFLVPLLIIVSTVLAVVAAIDNVRHDAWHITEGFLLLAAALLFFRSKLAKHHLKWVENRLLTELLRPLLLNELFHITSQLTVPTEEPKLWVEQSRLLLQHQRDLPLVTFVTPREDLLSARISAIADFSIYQATWHRNFADQHRVAQRRLARISAYAFLVTLFLCVMQLLMSYNLHEVERYLGETEKVAHVLMVLTLISAGGAFVLSILSHQLGFEAIAERSSNAAEHFAGLVQAIEHGRHAANARQVYAWAFECANVILVEQHSWYRHIPLIQMHL